MLSYVLNATLSHAVPPNGAPLCQFRADTVDPGGIALLEGPGVVRTESGEHSCVTVIPSGAYYSEDTMEFRLRDESVRRAAGIVVEIEYVDDGYGVMAAKRLVDGSFNGTWRPASRSVAFTRLNTGAARKCAFQFDFGGAEGRRRREGRPDTQWCRKST